MNNSEQIDPGQINQNNQAASITQATLAAAQTLKDLGFSVIPLQPKSKKPAIQWGQYQARHPSHQELQTWFGSGAKGLAVVTVRIPLKAATDSGGIRPPNPLKAATHFWVATLAFSLCHF